MKNFIILFFIFLTYQALASESIKINADNDILASNNDKDYTGALSVQYTQRTNQSIDKNYEIGFLLFTPVDIISTSVIELDRPYASLLYASTTKQKNWGMGAILQTYTFGVLGSDLPGKIQNEIHRGIDYQVAKGWKNQVSNGGEPTAMYSIIYKRAAFINNKYFQTTYDFEANLGYLTNLSSGVSVKLGIINSPWYVNNQSVGKIGGSTDITNNKKSNKREFYFYTGTRVKLVGYNAFLQGQFKENEHEFSYSDLRLLILEAWFGFALDITSNTTIGYNHRFQTSESTVSLIDRNFNWGSLNVTYVF